MTFEITFDEQDWKRFQSTLCSDLPKSRYKFIYGFTFNMIVWIALGAIFLAIYESVGGIHWASFSAAASVALIVFAYSIFQSWLTRKAFSPSESGTFIGKHKYELSESGISWHGNGYKSEVSWNVVQRICRLNGQILVFIDTAVALIFPENKVSDPDMLYTKLKEFHEKT